MYIHQALHGYNQGHNRLACSVSLSQKDDDLIKMLSDWSEYIDNKDNSYLTAYPLSDSGHYVVAKSWYADDMDRPGCVWTHSLIIQESILNDRFDFRQLFELFRRPTKGDYESYSVAILYEPKEIIRQYHYDKDTLLWLYLNLVSTESRLVYNTENSSEYYQHLLLMLIQYLPLQILKRTYLCSGSSYGRKYPDVEFNLQFASSTGDSLSKTVSLIKTNLKNTCGGIISICESMTQKATDTDRTIRLFSDEIKDDTLKLCAVGLLMKYLDEAIKNGHSQIKFIDILSIIATAFPERDSGIIIKKTFCRKQITSLFSKEIDTLTDLAIFPNSDSFDYTQFQYSERIQQLKSEKGLYSYINLLRNLIESDFINEEGKEILASSSKLLTYDDYHYLANNEWPIFMSLITLDSSILKYSFWIDLPESQFSKAYDQFRKYPVDEFDAWDQLYSIVLYRHLPISKQMMELFASKVKNLVHDTMEYLNISIVYNLEEYVYKYCIGKSYDVISWLEEKKDVSAPIVKFITEIIDPKSEQVKSTRSATWLSIYNCDKYSTSEYYVFLFLLGHNWKDENCLDYLRKGFWKLHQLLAQNTLPDYLWIKIEPYTEKLSFLQEWDKCKKLRKGIIRYLKSIDYSQQEMIKFTPDKELNEALYKLWNQ